MNEVAFRINVDECGKYLKQLGLLKRENFINSKNVSESKYSTEFIQESRNGSYENMYSCAMENDDYDFLLMDGSFFQFSICINANEESVRMAFYPSVCKLEYSQFLIEQLNVKEEDVGAEYLELYEQFIIEQRPNQVTPIRYDYNTHLYKEIIHSSAHLHIGYEENIRIPINKKIRPTLFVKFIVEYYYFDLWRNKIKNMDIDIFYEKKDFEDIERRYFSLKDEMIPFINIVRR